MRAHPRKRKREKDALRQFPFHFSLEKERIEFYNSLSLISISLHHLIACQDNPRIDQAYNLMVIKKACSGVIDNRQDDEREEIKRKVFVIFQFHLSNCWA